MKKRKAPRKQRKVHPHLNDDGRPPKRTKQQVLEAIQVTAGIVGSTAKRLNISRETMRQYMAKDFEIAAAVEEARNRISDIAENRLVDDIANGKDWRVRWRWLSVFAKDRGFTENVAVEVDEAAETRRLREENAKLHRQLLDRAVGVVVAEMSEERADRAGRMALQ